VAYKYQNIIDQLRRQIIEGIYPAGSALPTEMELCELFHASRQTVRFALSNLSDEGLIDRRQGSGSYVLDVFKKRSNPTKQRIIAIITTYISDYIFPSILREAEAVLSSNNCSTLLFATNNQVATERKVLLSLLDLPQLDGLLVEGTKTALPNPNLDLYRELLKQEIPLIFFNGNYPELSDVPYILDANFDGGYQLVEHLIGRGHSKIGGIFKSDDIQGLQRYSGYITALRDHGLLFEDKYVCWYSTETKAQFSTDSTILQGMLKRLENCTAVVCYNDEIATNLLKEIVRSGLSVPDDLAIVSFDNSFYSEMPTCRITSLSHGAQNIGGIAANSLIQLLSGNPCESRLIPWELLEKESS